MATNNFFGYSANGHPTYGAPAYPTPVSAVAQPSAVRATSAAQAAARAAAGYAAQQAAVVSAAPAGTYRTNTPAGVVAYTAYHPPQVTASYGTPATYHQTNSYPQYTTPIPATPVHTYVSGKATAYYAQPACVAPPVTYTVSDPHYQARPVYTTNSNVTLTHGAAVRPPPISTTGTAMAAAVAAAAAAHVPRPPTYTYSTTYAVQSSPAYSYGAHALPPQKTTIFTQAPPNVMTPVGATVDATLTAVYPTHNLTQQWNRGPKPQAPAASGGARVSKPRPPPKPLQLHYCEVCKISCAGPQTYKEHLEGQKHKKKEAGTSVTNGNSSGPAGGNGSNNNTSRSGNALRCELCDVTCTGSDAYAAHIRGAKHQKVMKLHTKLGKPIPSMEPTVLAESGGAADSGNAADRKISVVYLVPKKDFSHSVNNVVAPTSAVNDNQQQEVAIPLLPDERDVQPVGADYIEEVKSEDGKLISFNCKLCGCKFNDPNAKEMHMKGRRHRLQYKKKVNPDLIVDIKPTQRQRKLAEERAKRTVAREDFWRRREEEFRQMEEEERMYWQERRIFDEEYPPPEYHEMMRGGPRRGFGAGGAGAAANPGGPMPLILPGFYGPPMMRRPETIDDRHVMAKHTDIYPGDDTLAAIQKHVSHVEKALKIVSDSLSVEKNGVNGVTTTAAAATTTAMDDKAAADRLLKGVMRVGVLAKGLLLKGDSQIQLVLLCSQHPTVELLQRIVAALPKQLNTEAAGVKYDVAAKITDAAVIVTVKNAGIPLEIEVTLTSPVMREASAEGKPLPPSPQNALNKDRCLEALAALRQAKWFQARAASRQSCVVVIRILRDLCSREPAWKPLKLFLLELMTERVLASAPVPLPPGDALRRIFEALAGGLLLPDSPGFLDPCEKNPRDVSSGLTSQERENLTSSAQSFLRLMAFRQIHDVLQMDHLPQIRFPRTGKVAGRKRGPDETSGTDEDADGNDSSAVKREKLDETVE